VQVTDDAMLGDGQIAVHGVLSHRPPPSRYVSGPARL
jgi:hypothetical protein